MDELKTVAEHLEEFRKRFIFCLVVVVLLLPLTWFGAQPAINWIIAHLCPPEMGSMYYSAPMEVFFLKLRISLIAAVCIALPWIFWHIGRYAMPALYRHERLVAFTMSICSFVLFAAGAAIALFLVFPLMMSFSIGMQSDGIKPLINVTSCLGLAAWLMLGFGICFQLPVLMILLMRSGIVGCETMRRWRPYVVVTIFVVAGILTPPDVISQMALGIPTWLLYEISLLIGSRIPVGKTAPAVIVTDKC